MRSTIVRRTFATTGVVTIGLAITAGPAMAAVGFGLLRNRRKSTV
ncbi:hypothetical protein [Actinosynnema sp. ALI-1.44]|nr:hypothetical protein [Actinosynnema sp. ALI-1.44]